MQRFVRKLSNHRTLEWFSNGKTRITVEFVKFFQRLWQEVHSDNDFDIHEYVRELSKQKRVAIKAIEEGHGNTEDVPALPMYFQRTARSGRKRRRGGSKAPQASSPSKAGKASSPTKAGKDKHARKAGKGGKTLPSRAEQSSSSSEDSDVEAALGSQASSDAGSGNESD